MRPRSRATRGRATAGRDTGVESRATDMFAGRLGGVRSGSLSYPPWVKSVKDLKISQPIFGFSVRRQNLDALAGDWTASGRENIQLVLPRSERETPGEAHI